MGKGAKYTRSRRPVTLVYTEELLTHSDALKREAEIKKLSKAEKEKLACDFLAHGNTLTTWRA